MYEQIKEIFTPHKKYVWITSVIPLSLAFDNPVIGWTLTLIQVSALCIMFIIGFKDIFK